VAQVAEKGNEQNKIRLNWLKKQTTNQIREKKQTSNQNRETRLIDSSFSYPHLRPCVEPTRRSNQIARNSRTWLDVCFDWQLEIPVASFERSDWSFALFWFFRAIWLVVCFFSQLSRILFRSFQRAVNQTRFSILIGRLLFFSNLIGRLLFQPVEPNFILLVSLFQPVEPSELHFVPIPLCCEFGIPLRSLSPI